MKILHAEVAVPGYPDLILNIYGVAKAASTEESEEQGYHVSRNGMALIPDMPEQNAIMDYLVAHFPEHAQL